MSVVAIFLYIFTYLVVEFALKNSNDFYLGGRFVLNDSLIYISRFTYCRKNPINYF
uniref:Uncharacterized protein n=1 Tax=Heterorhabditis bacteriophora TaxID=37862 RepID=A0A1I7X8H8_HETBA